MQWGYGRQELHPLSDIDGLLFLSQQPLPPPNCRKSESINYLALGYPFRDRCQCEERWKSAFLEGLSDLTIATNLLEARLVCGNNALYQQLIKTHF